MQDGHCEHPHHSIGHKEEHTLLCCVSFSHVALIWKLNWNQAPGTASLSQRALTPSPGSLRLQLPACCNTAGTRNQAGMLRGKLARMLRGKQAGTARVAGEGRQCVTGGTKRALDDLVFLLHGIFGRSFLLGQGLCGVEVPTQQAGTLHLLPYGAEINCLLFGKLLCNPES